MAICNGNGEEHCCTIRGVDCPYLEEGTVPGRRWSCGLFVKYGTWAAVYDSAEYQKTDAAAWFADTYPGFGCGDWPQNIPEVMASVESGRVNPAAVCCWKADCG